VGWDTRSSGELLADSIALGLAREGWLPEPLGVLPTPAIARAVGKSGAPLGVAITASHNPASDNGFKLFSRGGRKLTDSEEAEVERMLPGPGEEVGPGSNDRGKASGGSQWRAADRKEAGSSRAADFRNDYVAAACSILPPGALKGWRIALDTANGATCATSTAAFQVLGADVMALGNTPDGSNINAGVGSEFPELLCSRVIAGGGRVGIAHDGDGDRCVVCDERGELLDGDELLGILAIRALERGTLAARTLVTTVQSNLGLDMAVKAAGGRVVRTPVGDRYVIEGMLAEGATLGGESSGHVIFSEIGPTGDGLVAALKLIEVMLETDKPLSQLRRGIAKFPQATASLFVREKKPLGDLPALSAAVEAVESEFGTLGRVLVRYSGTQSMLRLLVEGPDVQSVRSGLDRLVAAAGKELDLT
jgi:phosphoglucosamine mutase